MKTIQTSSDGTIKIKFPEGHSTVLIPSKENQYTLCLSSQIGCPMGCKFCLSGKVPFQRNLTTNEIKNQINEAIELTNTKTFCFSSVVFMGMGEPLLNLKNVITTSEWLNEKHNFSYAKITISTSGIIPKMKEVINYKFPIQLALSLHSTKQETRNKLMPNLKQYPIKDLIEICHEYNKKYHQKIMIEYLMIKDLTDTKKDLQNLIDYKFTKHTNFNLIPLNSTNNWDPSQKETIEHFKKELREAGYKCFIRTSTGQDIKAACGMLK